MWDFSQSGLGLSMLKKNAESGGGMAGNRANWHLGKVRKGLAGEQRARKFQEPEDGYLLTFERGLRRELSGLAFLQWRLHP